MVPAVDVIDGLVRAHAKVVRGRDPLGAAACRPMRPRHPTLSLRNGRRKIPGPSAGRCVHERGTRPSAAPVVDGASGDLEELELALKHLLGPSGVIVRAVGIGEQMSRALVLVHLDRRASRRG